MKWYDIILFVWAVALALALAVLISSCHTYPDSDRTWLQDNQAMTNEMIGTNYVK